MEIIDKGLQIAESLRGLTYGEQRSALSIASTIIDFQTRESLESASQTARADRIKQRKAAGMRRSTT